MQPYDFVMLVVLLGTLLFGVWKGMAWQVAALGSVVVSAAVAVHCSVFVAPWFSASEPWNRFFAIAVLYIATAAAIWLVFRLVKKAIDRVELKEFDRQLGAIFGLVKGVLYCVLITFFAVTLSEAARQIVLQSRSGDLIARGIRNANPILPEDLRTYLGKYIDELDEKLHAPPTEPSATDSSKPEVAEPLPGGGAPLPAPPAKPTADQPSNGLQAAGQRLKNLLPKRP